MDIQWRIQLPQQRTGPGKTAAAQLALRAGDLLTASVLDVEKGSDALLAFGRFKAYARMPLPMVTGQEVQIRIEQKEDRLRMMMVPKSGMPANLQDRDRLEIRLFEPVSAQPFLSDHSRSLVPGSSLHARITGFQKNGLMLVDFGEFKAFAKIDIPVRQGQTIPLNVVKGENGVTFAVDLKMRSPDPAHASRSMASMVIPREGQVANTGQASVGEPTRRVQPELILPAAAGATAAHAGPPAPPTVADMALLREQIQRLLNPTVQPEKNLSTPLPAGMKAALMNLEQALQPASTTGDTTTLMARVKDFVENSGIYFENRLEAAISTLQHRSTSRTPAELAAQPVIHDIMVKDLKPNLLILRQFLDSQPVETIGTDRHLQKTLKSMVHRAVSNIDLQQFGATEKPGDPDLLQAFSHLMFLTDSHRNARLKVYYAKKKGRDDAQKHPRISLLLDMDKMGTVRSDLWMVGKDLNITFFVQGASTRAAIEAEQGLIGEMLKDIFSTIAVSVVVNEKKIADFDGEELTLSDRRQVDLSI